MIVIGDRINGTVEAVRRAVEERDAGFIGALARAQAEAGADYIDVNVGGVPDERASMLWAAGVVLEAAGTPLCLDSSDPGVLSAALELPLEEPPFINSVNGDPEVLEALLPLASGNSCPVIALAMDRSGIPPTARGRLEVCLGIREAAAGAGVGEDRLYFDPLVLPAGVDHHNGRITLDTLALISAEMPSAGTVLGLSNISFGLPRRALLNRAMLAGAVCIGLKACLLDPAEEGVLALLRAAEAVSGHDPHCRSYLKAFRAGVLGADRE